MLNRQQCNSSNPCSEYGSNHSGCLSNLKSNTLGSSKYTLLPEAAEGLEKMYKDMPDYVKNNLKISDSYRPLEVQCKIFDFDKFESTGKSIKKGTSNTAAAKPGTSNHGWGRALDLSGPTAQKWIKENGPKYGWCWGEAKGEPWHFTFCGPGPNRYSRCDSMCKVDMSNLSSSNTSTNTNQETLTSKNTQNNINTTGTQKSNPFLAPLDAIISFAKGKLPSPLSESENENIENITEEIIRIKDILKKIIK
jgi:hypothetical protein